MHNIIVFTIHSNETLASLLRNHKTQERCDKYMGHQAAYNIYTYSGASIIQMSHQLSKPAADCFIRVY